MFRQKNITREIFFFKNHAENEAGRLVPDFFFFFLKKSFIWGKCKWSAAKFQSVLIVLNLPNNNNKIYKTLEYWSRDTLNFDFLKKGQGIVSPPHFVYESSKKMFLKLYSINWPNFIAWLHLLLEMLVNMCISINCQPGCDVIDLEINLILLIKPFSCMIKKSKQKFKYLENEKSL